MARAITQPGFRPTALHVWVTLGATFNLTGWTLSLAGQLNTFGYGIVLTALVLAGVVWWRRAAKACALGGRSVASLWQRLHRRFRRPLPLCFLVLAALIILGGCLHPPSNDDALSYRFSRVLNWLSESRWHWIHTSHNGMNSHVVGSEWLLAPWLAVLRTDRWVFIINATGYLLLPGLIFSLFRGLGVMPRVSWHWMWLLPSGYNFILQAGGAANDILGAVYALAGLHFALRAKRTGNVSDVWFGIICAALLSGCKLSNLPLLLPVCLALLPSARLLLTRPATTGAILLLAVAISVVPIASLNLKYCGDWTGAANESIPPTTGAAARETQAKGEVDASAQGYVFVIKEPWVGVTGNALILGCDNLFPPVFPVAGWWNAHIRGYLPGFYQAKLKENFEPDFLSLRELPGEERAGLGFGIGWLLVAGLVAGWAYRRRCSWGRGETRPCQGYRRGGYQGWFGTAVRFSPYVSLAVFMVKSGITAASRIVAPYYALLLPALLQSRALEHVVRTRWWARAELAACALAMAVLVVTPDRPLWPARTVLNALEQRYPEQKLIQRAARVYNVYAARHDVFRPVRQQLPEEVRTVGFFCIANETSTSLWRPFGARRVRHVLAEDTREDLQRWGIEYLVARDTGEPFRAWLERIKGETLSTNTLTLYAGRPPIDWCIVRLKP